MKKIAVLFALLISPAFADGLQTSAGGGGQTNTGAGGSITNLQPAALLHFRGALTNIRDQTGRGIICAVGSSLTTGQGAGSGGGLTGAYAFGPIADFARLLNAALASTNNSSPISYNSFYNDQNMVTAAQLNLYDPRLVLGANWAGSVSGLAGNLIHYTTGVVNNLSFTPNGSGVGTGGGVFDTIKVKYVKNAGTGTATINVDGGASLGTLSSAGGPSIQTDTFVVTRGTHTINIVPSNNGDFYVVGIIAYDSTIPAIDIIQLGWGGSTASNYNSGGQPYNPLNAIVDLGCSLTIISMTVNDSNADTGVPAYTTNLTAFVNAALTVGDVALMVDVPSNTTQATNGTLDKYIAAMAGIAASKTPSLVMLNMKQRFTSYAYTNPVMPYSDTIHPGRATYQDQGQAMAEVFGLSGP